ncbi:PREDICTED: poly [ADP-ribose] polymerase 9-like [Cyprinodon variegatus]|uniref:poly [ADP-ribose] polymerase 9-like n=1 Tax=Cyprinodon variegatus TaxID=28743 RepID=UPI00074269FB|nr:PREDICTED: poly [ADP-ribose] polymerase 9-like [Cyprinodon variegatus]
MASKLDIPLRVESLTIVKQCEANLCNILKTKFGCVATIGGVQREKESSTPYQRRPPTIPPQKRLEFMMPSGVKVSVWKADLTYFAVDAVVNEANDELKHHGGLALALSTARGLQIQKECEDYVKKHGKLKTGEAVVLDAGLLPCKKIIHAVGPKLPFKPAKNDVLQAEPLLKKTIWSILDKVEEQHLANVAIPAISSGLFNYPLPECAHTIVSTVKQYYQYLPTGRHVPQEIFFVNHDDLTVQAMETASHLIFSLYQHQSYSQAATRIPKSAPRIPHPSVRIGDVVLTLKMGSIEEQKTDVIVNTASVDRNLRVGRISSAILKKAGLEIQKEIVKVDKKKGLIIRTQSYRLQCKEVFHTFCAEKGLHPAAEKILYNSVLECLITAAAQPYTSISFPAIGIGAFRFSKDDSASIMFDAVSDFAKESQQKLEVYFVIFPSDHETFQVFEKKIEHFQKGSGPSCFPPAFGRKADSHTSRASTPHLILLGPSDESTHEAEKWLNRLLSMQSHTITIYNNFILHFRMEDHLRLESPRKGLLMKSYLTQGHACIEITSKTKEETVFAALEVEAMLCKIQKEFISEEEGELQMLSQTELSCKRQTVEKSSREFLDRSAAFGIHGLIVMKVEKVENNPLKLMFDLKKKQLGSSSSRTMFQCIPAQFCEMISRIGFQAECSPPEGKSPKV